MYLSRNIKFLRNKRGWNQTELGDRIEVSKASVSSYEAAVNQPTIDTLVNLAKLFKLSVDDLLFRDIANEGTSERPLPMLSRVEEPLFEDMNRLMKLRINELEREIRRHNPDLADELGIAK